MDSTKYTALAAECEKKAEQGEKPLMEWSPLEQDGTTAKSRMKHGDYEVCDNPWTTSWDIRGKRTIHDLVEDAVRSKEPIAAQLFAEALLRDATKPLHQGVYNELAEVRRDMERISWLIARESTHFFPCLRPYDSMWHLDLDEDWFIECGPANKPPAFTPEARTIIDAARAAEEKTNATN